MASTSGTNQKAFSLANIIGDNPIFDAIGELATANGIGGPFKIFTDAVTLLIDVVIFAGSVNSVDIFVDARGAAEVPKPFSLILFCLAVLSVGFTRYRVKRQFLA